MSVCTDLFHSRPRCSARRKEIEMRVQEASTPIQGPERPPSRPTEPGANEERLLVAKAKSGGSRAFGELYERHRTRVYRTAFRILRNAQDAEDAMQRSFQRALINLSRFRGDSARSEEHTSELQSLRHL